MAGGFFSRACNGAFRGSSFTTKLRANATRSKVNQSLQRKLHVTTKRPQCSLGVLAVRPSNLLQQAQYPPAFTILSKIQASGLHMTSVVAAGEGGEDGSDVLVGESSNEDSFIDPQLVDAELLVDTATPIDIFASTTQALDVPVTTLEGLGGYTPVGAIHHLLDFTHLSIGLPWWQSLIAATVAFRLLVFPLMVKAQANSARLNAVKPELEAIQTKIREASNYQNPNIQAQASQELQDFFKKHNCHPIKSLISPLLQLPLFISFFIAIRKMCYLPVESLQSGGVLWFNDLTAADPYFILPVLTAATMWLTIETGAEVQTSQMSMMKNVFRGMCVIMVPLTYNFPTALFMYWMTSNTLSLSQTLLMRAPAVKKFFDIPDAPLSAPVDPNLKQPSFWENMKAGYNSAYENAVIKEKERQQKKMERSRSNVEYRETFEYNPMLKKNDEIFKQAAKHKSKAK